MVAVLLLARPTEARARHRPSGLPVRYLPDSSATRYPIPVMSRLFALALLGGLSVAPIGSSRAATAVVPREARPQSVPDAVTGQPTLDAVSAIALASITWEGPRAIALDSRGRRHFLTLERPLQQAASQLLRTAKPSRGAVVVLSASDGRILALAESPSAVSHADSLVWSANTPSASLFKLITTAALVEHAQLQQSHRVCSEGGEHRLEAKHLEAPKQGRVVCTTFSEILASSRNAAYARLVHSHLSPDDLANFADRFGFNAPLPADVPAELGHFHPTTDPVRFARTATGFVGSSLSALGAAYLGLVIARGGVAYPLRLVEASPNALSDPLTARTPEPAVNSLTPSDDAPRPTRVLEPNTASRLREMMEKVVNHGTAADAFRDETGRRVLRHLHIAGKTGTIGNNEHTASWFVGFAPSREPKLVVAVLLDNGPIWQTTAKRVASAMMRTYFHEHMAAQLAAK
jgi:penicillin-binding protein A